MAEALLGWARNIIYYMVFLSLAEHLLAGSSYGRYLRLFGGLESEFKSIGNITVGIFYHSCHIFFTKGFSLNAVIREPLLHLNY